MRSKTAAQHAVESKQVFIFNRNEGLRQLLLHSIRKYPVEVHNDDALVEKVH